MDHQLLWNQLIGEGQLFLPPRVGIIFWTLPIGFLAVNALKWDSFLKNKLEDMERHGLYGGPVSSWLDPGLVQHLSQSQNTVPKEPLQLIERACLSSYKPLI